MVKFYSVKTMCKNLSLLGVLVFLLFILWTPTAKAALTDNVSGWMWSSNIGWISANCINTGDCTSTQDYGLNINPTTGALSGYAWSENIGYISFNRFETNDPPSAPYNSGSGPIAIYNSNTKSITGWARALSGCERIPGNPVSVCASTGAGDAAGGFDGWIKLSGTARDGSPYGIGLSGDNIGGHAWGADVIGWVEFNLSAPTLNIDEPELLFTSSLMQVPTLPHDVDLTWATDNINSCTASGGWSGSKSASGGTETVTVSSDPTTYHLQCIGDNDQVINKSITIIQGAAAHFGWIAASNCTIAVGETDCLSEVEWFARDYAAPISVKQAGSEFSNSPVGHEMLPVSHGDTLFSLSDIDALSASTMAIAACETGSTWNGSVCESDTPIPSGSLSISNCEIAEGDSDCDGSVTWNSGNLASPPSVWHNGSVIFVSNSGTRTFPFGRGSNNFSLTDSSGNLLDTYGVTTDCSPHLTWDPVSGTCIIPPPTTPLPPTINIDANPNLIRSGETAEIVIDIESEADLTCTLSGVESSIYTFQHDADLAPVQQYVEITRTLTDSQIIDIECEVDIDPSVSNSASTRVNVIPGVQEI